MRPTTISTRTAAIVLCFAAGAASAQEMSKDAYKSAHDRIVAEAKSAETRCNTLSANAKDICMAEAKGNERVAKADLDARNKPSDQSRYALSIAKAEATYAVSKEKCDDKVGNDKNACMKEAKATEDRAKADAKAHMKTADGGKPAKEASKSESAGAYVDDAMITTKVKAAILQEGSLKSAEINVETLKGTVQLSGFVRSQADINKAVEVARTVNGVKVVKNDMILKGSQ